jgi:molybdopterin molybdotransferase
VSTAPGFDEARRLARDLGRARVPRSVPVALERAGGRVLAVEVRAGTDLPVAAVSAMDGWAVRGDGPWQVVESQRLQPGQAARVGTGAALPAGAVAVVRDERARTEGATVSAPSPEPGTDVRPRGEEWRAGEVVADRGAVLTPLRLGVVAAAGADAVHVVVPPRTVLLVTGDELVASGLPRPGRTRDSLSHVLPPMLRACGVDLERAATAGDDVETLRDVFAGPYRSTVDLVVTSGGTARGAADHVRRALADVGARTVVAGTAVRPGAPAILATVPDGPVVAALPGNPLAAVAALVTLVQPLLASWLGRPDLEPAPVRWTGPGGALPRHGSRLVPARLQPGGDAVRAGHDGPGMLRGLAAADGFVVCDADGRTRWVGLPG